MTTLLALLLASAPTWAAERTLDRIAAVVDDEVIALSEVYELGSDFIDENCPQRRVGCMTRMEGEVLEALVQRTLQRQELRRRGQDVTAADVDRWINQIIAQYGFPDREAFRAEIERSGADWVTYRQQQVEAPLREQKFQQLVLRDRVVITDDELRDRYQRMIRDLEAPQIARIEALGYAMPTDGGSEAITTAVQHVRAGVEDVREGRRTWSDLVAELDTAGVSSLFAGQTYERDDLAPQLADVVFRTEVDQIADPLLTGGVLYVIKVVERGEGDKEVASFEDAKEGLMDQIFGDKIEQAQAEWVQQAKRRAAIRRYVGPDADPSATTLPTTDDEGT